MLPKIGLRNIKTALAVLLCFGVFALLGRENAFFACVAAVICMQNTIDSTLQAGKNRLIGSVLGGALGYVFVEFLGRGALLSSLGIVVIIYLCNLLKQKEAIVLACVVFLSIIINLSDGSVHLYAFNRVLDTFIGIVLATVINYFIKSPEAKPAS